MEVATYDWRISNTVFLFNKEESKEEKTSSGQLLDFLIKQDFRIYFGVKNNNGLEQGRIQDSFAKSAFKIFIAQKKKKKNKGHCSKI